MEQIGNFSTIHMEEGIFVLSNLYFNVS